MTWTRLLTLGLWCGASVARAGTLHAVPSGGATAGLCPETAPCTLARALVAAAAGDTVELASGTYSEGSVTLSGANHQNVTLTTTAATVTALGAFRRGMPQGSDARPYFPAVHVRIAASGARVSYLRLRNAAAPHDGAYDGIVAVDATGVTVDHCELWNGNQGVQVNVKKQVTITQNHIHDLGSLTSTEDTHGVAIVGSGAAATGWAEALVIDHNSIHRAGGDAVQESTNCYASGTFQFLTMDSNDFFDNQEQAFDAKGTRDVRFSNNDVYGNGYGGLSATTPEDCPNVASMDRWDIFSNTIHDQDEAALYWANSTMNASAWRVFNNLIYRNLLRPAYNGMTVVMPGDAASWFVGNTLVDNTPTNGKRGGGIADCGMGANLRNNLFLRNGDSGGYGNISSSYYACTVGGTPTHNYVYPATPGQPGSAAVSTCQQAANCAGFTDAAAYDLSLALGSPAIDQGVSLPAPFDVDFTGTPRAQGQGFDLGALEYGSSASGGGAANGGGAGGAGGASGGAAGGGGSPDPDPGARVGGCRCSSTLPALMLVGLLPLLRRRSVAPRPVTPRRGG